MATASQQKQEIERDLDDMIAAQKKEMYISSFKYDGMWRYYHKASKKLKADPRFDDLSKLERVDETIWLAEKMWREKVDWYRARPRFHKNGIMKYMHANTTTTVRPTK